MSKFRALVVEKSADGKFTRRVMERSTDALPAGDVLVDVRYSSLNYKDGLSATGNPGVTRNFPHTPGIDAAGTVLESASTQFKAGDEVIVIGFDLGMNTPGGFGQRIRVPAGWVVPRPAGLGLEESMILGTAGFTAALAIDKLEASGMRTGGGPVLVTGATGGVGSVAVMLLARLGYEVAAVTGKASQHDFLKGLGAKEILARDALIEGANRPMLKERWGGVVDTVGGDILFNAVKSLQVRLQSGGVRARSVAAVRRDGAAVHPAPRQSARHRFGTVAALRKNANLEQACRRVGGCMNSPI